VQLVPLFDKTGTPSYWADPVSSQIFDATGQAVAFIGFDSIFDRSGKHIGWWYGNHIRDHVGRLLLVMRGAQITGLNLPLLPSQPRQPSARHWLPRPSFRRLENHPLNQPQWSLLPLIANRNDRIMRFLQQVAQHSGVRCF
jgi:hypothetical protein